MALTKADMAKRLFNDLGWEKNEAHELVDLFFQELVAPLEAGEQVKISGFGSLNILDKKGRPGRNLKTAEDFPIPARLVVTFRTGPKLKARVAVFAGIGE